jgi:hypothetical protein
MRLKYYFPISVGLFATVVAGAYYSHVPIAPLAIILLVGETLLGFQLEDHRVQRILSRLFRPVKHGH